MPVTPPLPSLLLKKYADRWKEAGHNFISQQVTPCHRYKYYHLKGQRIHHESRDLKLYLNYTAEHGFTEVGHGSISFVLHGTWITSYLFSSFL